MKKEFRVIADLLPRNIRVLEAQYVDLVVDEVQRLLKGF